MIRLPRKHGDVLLDDEDASILDLYWITTGSKQTRLGPYTRAFGRAKSKPHRTSVLPRILLQPPDGLEIDHINQDPLDNRRENLRVVTHAFNLTNRRTQNKNWYKGVRLNRRDYEATFWLGGAYYKGPRRKSPELAALDYNRMLISVWGRDLHLNDPPCVSMYPVPSDTNCLLCNACCHCCCVCGDRPTASMTRLFSSGGEMTLPGKDGQ